MVEARGLFNRLFIDFWLGKPVDMAQVKTIGFFLCFSVIVGILTHLVNSLF